ncbi:MAG: molybdopterin-dependent oxidoreductase [Tissierellia bacterium]|jgi:thiosulfate reductase/polysulfide reductase chain A|nr:molybdopterin-dependent oxidoreductase [Tissierellia bacterium]
MLKDLWKKEISRRKFLKTTGLAVATTAVLTACDTKYLTEERKLSPAANKSVDHRNYPFTYTAENVTKINTTCYMCAINCTAVGVVDEDGILKRMEPNKLDPVSNGTLCAKGNAGVAQLYDEDRLKTPMRKVAENEWEEITWDEAFDIMHEEFTKIAETHGPETVFALNRRGYYSNLLTAWLKEYGTPNGPLGQESICDGGKRVAQQLAAGAAGLYCDFKNSKYIMLFGANQMEAPRYRLGMPGDILTAQENGAKLIVIDPRFNYSAAKADEYHRINAGTDGLMIMAMNHVIIREGLEDKAFIEAHSAGFEEYKAEVSKPEYSPEAVAEEVGIDAATIERLAIEFASADGAVADTSSGIIMFQNGTQADLHLLNLVALTGNMLGKGGILRRQSSKRSNPKFEVDNSKGKEKFWGALGYPYYSGQPEGGNRNIIADCILTPDAVPTGPLAEAETLPLYEGKGLKGVIVYQTDPIGAQGETVRLIEAFNNLDFGVVIDIYLNQSAEALPIGGLALPEATYLERYASRSINAYTSALALSQAVVPPMYETKSAYWIFTKLGQRFGYADFMALDADGEEQAMIESVEKADQGDGLFVDFAKLKEEGVWMLKDPDARNYENYAKVFPNEKYRFSFVGDDINDDHKMFVAAAGGNPVPGYIRPVQTTGEYPLRFMAGGKVMWHTQTSTRNNKYLMQIFDENTIVKDKNYIVMSPDDAGERGLETGSIAVVSSPVSSIEGEVLVTERVPKGYVHMTHGYGHRAPTMQLANGVGQDCGDIVEAKRVDPISNCFTMKEEICNVVGA